MPTPTRHFKEEIQDWLDGRLDAATAREVERHVETCPECRREYESLGWTKQIAARQFAPQAAPAELRENILHALRAEEPLRKILTPPAGFWQSNRRSIVTVAALVAMTLAGLYFLSPAPLPELMMKDYRAYRVGSFPLQLSTDRVRNMETFFKERGVPFQTRVFDLDMMNYRLVGGRVQSPYHHPRAAFVYRGPGGEVLLCQMFAGQVANLPSGAAEHTHKGIKFYTYRNRGLTAVFWQEGTIVCALVSDMTPAAVRELAFAKAEAL